MKNLEGLNVNFNLEAEIVKYGINLNNLKLEIVSEIAEALEAEHCLFNYDVGVSDVKLDELFISFNNKTVELNAYIPASSDAIPFKIKWYLK